MISGIQFFKNGVPDIMQIGEYHAKVSEFRHNQQTSAMKMLVKYF
jgi:hypothetical protein